MADDTRTAALQRFLADARLDELPAGLGAHVGTRSRARTAEPLKTWSSFPEAEWTPVSPATGRPLQASRVPVFVERLTAEVFVTSVTPIIAEIATSFAAAAEVMFLGNGPLQAGIRGRRLAALRAHVEATYQDSAVLGVPPDPNAGLPPDLYAGETVVEALGGVELTVFPTFEPSALNATQASHAFYPTYAMRPWPLHALREGLVLPEGCRPLCDHDTFHMSLTFPSDLSELLAKNDVCLTVEFYVEATFV